jgi:protein-disulfide isomerase
VVSNRVEQNEYRDQVLQIRKRAVKIGVDSTPTVLVNGHFLQNRSLECMNTFIEQAQSGELGGTASK